MMAARIDLNSDMGESFGAWTMGHDESVLPYITSANVACGFHAGDPRVMARTVRLAKSHGVSVGAHPAFPDLVGFGRRNLAVTPEEAHTDVLYQIGALHAFCRAENIPLAHVKPHGQLNNLAVTDASLADAILDAIELYDRQLILIAYGGELLARGRARGLTVAQEVYVDRAYLPDGRLAPRSLPGAVIQDPSVAARRAVEMVLQHRVPTLDGQWLTVTPDTICIHGDNPGAVELARAVRRALDAAGVEVLPLGHWLRTHT
ncbi:Lactam utilization related protein (lamB) [Sulfobacillus acidophilus TPY]|nr:Lactam utilization related protein (lamB) [Sulfobacillus acidophilus TPY]